MTTTTSPLVAYRKQIEQALTAGNATEHTYRTALKGLIEALAPGVNAVNEPKRIACGAPDYIIQKSQTPLGYIEAKDIGVSLDKTERGEQMGRYLTALGNLLLTDYLEFRWYVGGEWRMTARLATVGRNNKLRPEADGEVEVENLLRQFLASHAPTIGSPKALAQRMASLAHLLRDALTVAFDGEGEDGMLHQQLLSFREVLLHDLTSPQFADMYAQTICYGLFTARCFHTAGTFTRASAAYHLPKTNPFLRKMFGHIAGPDLDDQPFAWVVDDLADLLDRADIGAILENFGKRTRQEDPVVHFYETFLAAYDPKLREARGVYYTPEPVVSYIVRSVDHLLKTEFNLPAGLADTGKVTVPDGDGTREMHRVQILDPATGTGTFLHGVIDQIHQSLSEQGQAGMWSSYVSQHLLPRIFGFELMMAPYAVAHLKLGLQLGELGYDFHADERLNIFLTNTLEAPAELQPTLPFAQWLAAEANAANKVKREMPILVVLGNPPYSANSENTGEWIIKLVKDSYYPRDEIKEANPKLLLDDYVKFIRFAQWRIDQTGFGILAFISNHGYLDNPTFRGMRKSLMESFDDIYIIDLHGNAKKKEMTPDGGKDENVFDIQQGVSIGVFVKHPSSTPSVANNVYHSELWGCRKNKYSQLNELNIASTNWNKIDPQRPFLLFVPTNFEIFPEYSHGSQVTNIFPVHSSGPNTLHDQFAITFEKNEQINRINDLFNTSITDDEVRNKYGITDSRDWKLSDARRAIQQQKIEDVFNCICKCIYRPFDIRYITFNDAIIGYPIWETTRHLLFPDSIGLSTTRQIRNEPSFLASRLPFGQHKIVDPYDRSYVFPLYLYPTDKPKSSLFDMDEPTDVPGGRRPNLSPEFVADVSAKLGMAFVPDGVGDRVATFGPEDVFHYMYAIFHAPGYRARYAEFLKIDFPRLPLTSQPELFRALCALGAELTALHLMEQPVPGITQYPVAGDNLVEKVRYSDPHGDEPGKVWINATQYIAGVPPETWAFHVGGYQVCDKWLKDRKGRRLSYDDLTHYQQVVAILTRTRAAMAEIDAVIEAYGGWPLG